MFVSPVYKWHRHQKLREKVLACDMRNVSLRSREMPLRNAWLLPDLDKMYVKILLKVWNVWDTRNVEKESTILSFETKWETFLKLDNDNDTANVTKMYNVEDIFILRYLGKESQIRVGKLGLKYKQRT